MNQDKNRPKLNFNPNLDFDEDNLDWLELPRIPEITYNPLLDFPLDKYPDDPFSEIVGLMSNPNYLHFAVKELLNINLLPFQLVILDTLWRKRVPMLIGSRGLSKSFLLAVYALLRMIFHPGCKVVIVGSAFRQSRQVFDYMATIWENAPVLRDIVGNSKNTGPKREVDRCQFNIGRSTTYAVPLGTGEKIRGLRANYILVDEYATVPEEIFNVVVQGFGSVAASPVEKVKESAVINKLKKMGKWTPEMQELYKVASGGNQIVYSGTAYYEFNHFAKNFKKWRRIIYSKGDISTLKEIFDSENMPDGFDWRDYAVLRIPYTCIPTGWLDPGIIAQAKATLSHSQFMREYGACFVADSDGFFRRSIIESATTNKPILVPGGKTVQFSALRYGKEDKAYIMGIDPAADVDNAAIVILEDNIDYRKVVYCWTTNKRKYQKYRKFKRGQGEEPGEDYYRYIARKIRELMRNFNIEHIMMDKNGGGTAIQEALMSRDTFLPNEHPVYETIDPENPKPYDIENGLHILEMVKPSQEFNSESNHGMKKDLEDKVLLFPMFDTIEIEKASELDKINKISFDTYEDIVMEIEELKNEMTTIIVTPSSTLGKETFDTPLIKGDHDKKGRLRKDRYSALLYANYYGRNRNKNTQLVIEYKPVGGTRDTVKTTHTVKSGKDEPMYHGWGMHKFGQNNWNNNFGVRRITKN